MNLTKETYYSLEANNYYMSNSLYNSFVNCEAATMAYLAGEWVEEKPTAFLVGSYVHAWAEGTLDEFMSEHPECFTKSGSLRAEFKQAEKMIETLKVDPFAMHTLQGGKEVIMTAEIDGVPWKIKPDVYVPGKRIVDLKTTRSIRELQWSQWNKGRVTFIEQYNYFQQVAIYLEVERINAGRSEGDWLDFYMVAVSKEKIPDKEVINLTDHERVMVELSRMMVIMPRILAIKEGRVEPFRCEACNYCRSTKRLSRALYYKELEGDCYA